MNYQIPQVNEQKTTTAFERFSALAKKTFSGGLFLALSILVSAMTLLQLALSVWSFLSSLAYALPSDSGFFTSLVPLTMMILTTVGCWLVYAGAKGEGNNYGSKLGLVKVFPVYTLICYYVVAIVLGIVGLFSLVATDLFDELLYGTEGLLEDSEMIIDGILNFAVYAVILLFAIVASVLTIIRYTKLANMLGAVKYSLEKGRVPRISPMFFCVLSFMGSFLLVVGGLVIMFSSPLSGIFFLVSAAASIISSILILTAKAELDACVKMEKEEIKQAEEQKKQMMAAAAAFDPRYMYAPQQYAPYIPPQYAPQQYVQPQQQYAPQQYAQPQKPQYAPQQQYAQPQQPRYAAPQQFEQPQQVQESIPQPPRQYAQPQQQQYTAPAAPEAPAEPPVNE